MKTIALTLIAAALGFAQSQSGAPATEAKSTAPKTASHLAAKSKAKTPPQPKAAQKPPAPVKVVPPGATLVEPNLYRFTDSNGKTWMYRQTPFGLSKWEETAAPAPEPPAAAQSEKVAFTDLGDSVRFEKKTPFGVTRWVHKKTELTDDEKTLISSQPGRDNKTAEKQ